MKLNHISLLTTALLVISCQEKVAEQDWTAPADGKITLEVTVPDQDGENLLWPEGAMIGFSCVQTGNSNTPFELAASTAGTEQAAFYTGIDWAEGLHQMTVYYPYKEVSNGTVLSGNLPSAFQNISGSAGQLASKNLYYGKVETEENAAVKVALTPIFSLAEVQISGSSYAGYSLDQISFKATSGKALTGDYTFDLSNGVFTFAENASANLVISTTQTEISAEGVKAWFLTNDPETLNEKVEITVNVTKDKKSKLLTGEGTLKGITEIDLNGFTSEELTDNAIDLSDPDGDGQKETANCYIAGKAGLEYKFPATVMGNGATLPAIPDYPVANACPGITPQILVPMSAKLLWQTEKSLITNVNLKNGYVYFTLNGEPGGKLTEGNALIAVYDDAAASGNILWSWHIWVTDDDLDANLQTWKIHPSLEQYSAFKDPQLMDRNLGALDSRSWKETSNNLNQGLFYQWGRKDPFIGIDDSSYGSLQFRQTYDAENKDIPGFPEQELDDYTKDIKWVYVKLKPLSVETLALYPMQFYWVGTTKHDQFWMDEIRHDLWGDPRSLPEENTTGQKTIYDPCPAGYRVMNAYVFSGVTDNLDGGKYQTDTDVDYSKLVNRTTYANEQDGLRIKYDGVHETVVPATALMLFEKRGSQFLSKSASCYMWTSKMSGASDNKRASRLQFDAGSFHAQSNGFVSYGSQVRCEKIK